MNVAVSGGSSIVVVNHDPTFLTMIQDLLVDEGYRVVVQRGSHGTYELIREVAPDLVILDVQLENVDDGWRILDLIRLDPALTEVPVLVCATDPRLLQAKAGLLRRKRCDTLEKPFDLNDLLAKIGNFIGPGTEQADTDRD